MANVRWRTLHSLPTLVKGTDNKDVYTFHLQTHMWMNIHAKEIGAVNKRMVLRTNGLRFMGRWARRRKKGMRWQWDGEDGGKRKNKQGTHDLWLLWSYTHIIWIKSICLSHVDILFVRYSPHNAVQVLFLARPSGCNLTISHLANAQIGPSDGQAYDGLAAEVAKKSLASLTQVTSVAKEVLLPLLGPNLDKATNVTSTELHLFSIELNYCNRNARHVLPKQSVGYRIA